MKWAVRVVSVALVVSVGAPAQAQVALEKDRERLAPGEALDPWYLGGGIGLVTAGLGMAALGTWAALRMNDVTDDPRRLRFEEGVPPYLNACSAAESGIPNKDYRLLPGAMFPSEMAASCSDESELVAVQLVAFPTSIVFSGLGALLIAEAFGHGPDDLQVLTAFGPDYNGATVSLSF